MIIVKKIDEDKKNVTVSNNGELQPINFDEFLTIPNVDDVIEPQQSTDNSVQFVIVNNTNVNSSSQKSKLAAGLLGIFLGGLGIHNFYLGNTVKAVIQLLIGTLGWFVMLGWVSNIWGSIEGIIILCSKKGSNWHQDANGNELSD
ncbi:NINE protein [Pediococcus argentinicus]|uniref:NINE protein n=1 Tax=Pediococcus argentinicus TaxID=480391 RepID=UPI00338D761E